MYSIHIKEKIIGKKILIKNLSLDILKGEFISILGLNGCGKSTLLKIIMGLDKNFVGNLEIPTRDLSISMMFQENRLLSWYTVAQNIEFALPSNISRGQRTVLTSNILNELGLKEVSNLYPKEISGGMAQRASLARAMINKPELLLLDEPLGSLDEITKWEARVFINSITANYQGCTIMATHSIEDALYLSDRVLVFGGSPTSIIKDYKNSLKGEECFSEKYQEVYNELKKDLSNGKPK